jgi:hypothetical protein
VEANRRLQAAGFDRFSASVDYLTAAGSVPEFNYHRTVVEADAEVDALVAVGDALGEEFAVFSVTAAPRAATSRLL